MSTREYKNPNRLDYACGLDGKYCLLAGCQTCRALISAAPELLVLARAIRKHLDPLNTERAKAVMGHLLTAENVGWVDYLIDKAEGRTACTHCGEYVLHRANCPKRPEAV